MNAFREIPSLLQIVLSYSTVQTGARTDQTAKHAKEKRRMTSRQYHFISAYDSFITFIVPSRATRPHSHHYPYILMDSQSLHL